MDIRKIAKKIMGGYALEPPDISPSNKIIEEFIEEIDIEINNLPDSLRNLLDAQEWESQGDSWGKGRHLSIKVSVNKSWSSPGEEIIIHIIGNGKTDADEDGSYWTENVKFIIEGMGETSTGEFSADKLIDALHRFKDSIMARKDTFIDEYEQESYNVAINLLSDWGI